MALPRVALLLAAVLLAGCSQATVQPTAAPPTALGTTTPTTSTTPEASVSDDLPPPDPAFAAHFTDPVYSDPAGELAPFGTDEGADMLYDWAGRLDELGPDSTVRQLLEGTGFDDMIETLDEPEGPGIPEPAGQVDAATIVIGAGFTLLRLTGHIDDEGRRLTLRALDILIARYGSPPEMVRQRADLLSWRN